jgi:hypothetical protein
MENTMITTVVEEADKRKGKGRYWYFITIYECVLCFAEEEYRERRYTPRPKEWGDRHELIQYARDQHFM